MHIVPQLMPAGTELTVPVPVFVTVNMGVVNVNVAVTLFADVTATVQVVAMPLHAPPQPPNTEPVSGVAVSVTLSL
jgi:hypothetical protein